MAPLRRGGLHRRHAVFSSLVGTAQTITQRAEERVWQRLGGDDQEVAAIAEAVERCAVPHQHKLVGINVVLAITTVCLIMWQANMLPTRLLQGHNLASTITATGIFGEVQEEKPSMTREELLGSNHRQSLSEGLADQNGQAHRFPVPELH